MTKLSIFTIVLLGALSVQAADIETQKALIRSVDKVTGRTKTMTVVAGQEASLGSLKITLERCLKKPPEEMPENKAFLRIFEDNDTSVFQGWMFSSNPALSAMEHPIYDIWVLECVVDMPEKEAELNIPETTVSAEPVDIKTLPDIKEETPVSEEKKTSPDNESEEDEVLD